MIQVCFVVLGEDVDLPLKSRDVHVTLLYMPLAKLQLILQLVLRLFTFLDMADTQLLNLLLTLPDNLQYIRIVSTKRFLCLST
ncbi:unnamed protein product [Aphanomyces euteiches]|nr:hypothetical protein Ae201684P_015978 [Aphanomyces euteiches]